MIRETSKVAGMNQREIRWPKQDRQSSTQVDSQKPRKNENHITEGGMMLKVSSLARKLRMCSGLQHKPS